MTGAKRRFLFIHQNFPGQFVHLSVALAKAGHEGVALGIDGRELPGVRYVKYAVQAPPRPSAVAMLRDVEAKVARGLACADAMLALRRDGFEPDIVVAHPGWGEALFCKDIWPHTKLIVFAEFFYNAEGADYNFDPEFATHDDAARFSLRVKNTALLHALHACDWAYAPTQWQRSQLPPEYRHKVDVIFDGIDTNLVAPNPGASIHLSRDKLTLRPTDEVVTFVNRNLEPYRGFHQFMRALPAILAERPKAHCVMVGRDDVSYGKKPANGRTWREVMLAEVGGQLPMDRVHFVGSLKYADYVKVLQVSTCHVYLTYPFVLGWSCVEALSAGCTVVASDTPPVREVIDQGRTGRLVDFFDHQALAREVVAVLERPDEFRALGRAARQHVVERYDLHRSCLPAQLQMIERVAAS